MTRNPLNEAFLRTSFLSGANAAYVEDMQAEYERNPGSVSDEWRHFFESLKEERSGSPRGDRGPSWGVPAPELLENGEIVSALTGAYEASEHTIRAQLQAKSQALGFEMTPAASLRATQDSIRALTLIRAYRVMGHLAADLDPLGLADRKVHLELKPETYGFTDADLDRPIFIDRVLGLETATMRQIVRILRRTYCRHIGVQYMHITEPGAEGVDPGPHRGRGKGHPLHPRGQAGHPQQARRGGDVREVLRGEIHRHQALRHRRRRIHDSGAGADHQARRSARASRRSSSAWRIAGASTCSAT